MKEMFCRLLVTGRRLAVAAETSSSSRAVLTSQARRQAHSRGAIRMWSVLDKKLNTKMQPCLQNSNLLIGQVLPDPTIYQEASGFDPGALTKQQKVVDVRVPYYVYDEYFKAFHEHEWDFLAVDGGQTCKSGDTVLMRRREEAINKSSAFLQHLGERQWWKETADKKPKNRDVTFEVLEVIYRLGEVVDPLTQKPVIGEKYVDQLEKEAEMYGKHRLPEGQEGFSYKKAPSRGRQEGKRDFTARKTYQKWHNFKKNDRYGISS